MISQSTNQGTVSPTHFHILEDTNELASDRLQIITYRFTHLYYNWPVSLVLFKNKSTFYMFCFLIETLFLKKGQLRVPAPCHYAQKLAHLVGESLHTPHSPELDEKLFYL